MMDDWLLEHIAKVTTLSCVLIVMYFLIYSIWRISRMPNYPWNWNEWNWPGGGRNAVEIIRNRTEMPFTVSLVDSHKEDTDKTTIAVNYLKQEIPPDVTVLWGPSVEYLMKLINSPWHELMNELMMTEIEPGQWKCLLGSEDNNNSDSASSGAANYFILHRLELISTNDNRNTNKGVGLSKLESQDVPLSDLYHCNQLELKPPMDFDWNLLKNQYRYPAAVFVTNYRSGGDLPSIPQGNENEAFGINGIIQIIHVKNELFLKTSSMLAQYIKMNNGQSHILQSLFVMDDHRMEEEDAGAEEESAAGADQDHGLNQQEPFSDILCSVCQASPVTRVIIPCRHLCLCTRCFEKVEICPICRGAIMYYFKTRKDPLNTNTNSSHFITNPSHHHNTPDPDESQNLTLWQRIENFNDRFSYAAGLIRQY